MATTLFLRGSADSSDYSTGNNDTKIAGSAVGWQPCQLSLTRGAALSALTNNTVTGPTDGIELLIGSIAAVWYSPPLDADVTISGSIIWNLWASESSMSANIAINGILEVIDGATGAITLIDKTARVVELAVTTNAVNNFAETPAAGIACKRGDRLRVRIFGDDAGTMATGFNTNFGCGGATAGVDGDSYFTLTENLTFVSEPAGSQIFPTDTASDVATASIDRESWTSRGAGVQTDVTNSAAGWTAPLQITDTAAGTVVDWFTRQLVGFTLGGAVRCNIRALQSGLTVNASAQVQIAVVDSDGTNPVVWAVGCSPLEITLSEAAYSFLISGDDLSVAAGKRLRIRLSIDDFAASAMGSGGTVTLYYAGTSGGASGDTYVTFTQTLTELIARVPPRSTTYPQLLAH